MEKKITFTIAEQVMEQHNLNNYSLKTLYHVLSRYAISNNTEHGDNYHVFADKSFIERPSSRWQVGKGKFTEEDRIRLKEN